MIRNSKGIGFPQGEEENDSTETGKVVSTPTKASSSIVSNTNSSPWLRLKDPRIVRVSRVFGGKDRHSKVCTIRGLRDRRVRLSVPTAINLYDLQDRLGLNQPSKVVDWLLNAAKDEIDELPPLPMPIPGTFTLLPPPRTFEAIDIASPSNDRTNHNNNTTMEWESGNSSNRLAGPSNANPWNSRSKEVMLARDQETDDRKLVPIEREERTDTTILPRENMNNHPFFPGMINNIAYNMSNSYRWDPPNYPLLNGLTDHGLHGVNVVSLHPSALSLSTGSQFLFGPNTSTTTSVISSAQTQFHEPRQQALSHFHMLSSNLPVQSLLPNPMRSLFHFGTNDNTGSPSEQSKERE